MKRGNLAASMGKSSPATILTPKSLLLTAGFLALWVEIAYSLGAVAGGLSEPFPNVEAYFKEVLDVSLVGGIFFLFVLAILAIAMIALRFLKAETLCESLAKAALAMFLPTVFWATMFAFDATNDSTLTLYEGAPPTWMASPWIRFFGRFEWLYALLLTGLGIWVLLYWRDIAERQTVAVRTTR